MALRKITQADLKDLQMPPDAFGNPGATDIEALKAAAWGSDYDVDARKRAIQEQRDRIAALLMPQTAAATASDAAIPRITMTPLSSGADQGTSQGVSGSQSGDAGSSSTGSSATTGSSFGGSAAPGSSFMGGAPPGPSILGTSDRTSFNASDLVTSPAAMVGEQQPGGAYPASLFGRIGDDSSPQSQAKEQADADALAAAALGRALADPSIVTDIAEHAPTGKGDKEAVSQGNVLTDDPSATGTPGYSPSGRTTGFSVSVPGSIVEAFGNVVDAGKTAISQGWGAVTTPFGAPATSIPSAREMSERSGRNQPTPERSFTQPGAPDEGSTATPGGFGPGFSEGTPGGYAGGPGMTTGFGAGYAGSSEFGNTQGAQGFTTGMPGGAVTPSASFNASTAAAFAAGFDAGAASVGGQGGQGEGAGQGDTSGGGGGGGGQDPGGSPGGVG